MSDDAIQEARIALYREFGANARNWYSVLLAMAIVLFAAVQVRRDLASMGLWEITLAVIFSQVIYAVIRAAVSVKLARKVVTFDFRPDWPHRNILGNLDDKAREKLRESRYWSLGLDLGDDLRWWIASTIVCSLAFVGVICILTPCFSLWHSLGCRPQLLPCLRPLCRLAD